MKSETQYRMFMHRLSRLTQSAFSIIVAGAFVLIIRKVAFSLEEPEAIDLGIMVCMFVSGAWIGGIGIWLIGRFMVDEE